MPLHCEIVSPERLVFAGEVDMVIAPGTEGVLGILPHHAPLLTTLTAGELRLRQQGTEIILAVFGGVLQVSPEGVIVLADTVERAEEIDIDRARAARQQAEASLRSAPPGSEAARHAENSLRRSQLRLNVSQRYRRGSNRPAVD